jgi:predicted dehydrogenase
MNLNCWLIGAGYMAQEYIKVLKDKRVNITVIGRGKDKVDFIKAKFGVNAFSGGILAYLNNKPELPKFAIIAVSCEELYSTTKHLIELGIRNILVEKPAGLTQEEISELALSSEIYKVNLFVAYNRRFYHSVEMLRERINAEGGIQSIQFEFTEWVHTIDTQKFPTEVLSKFLIANSSHVIDTVFFLAGKPKEIVFFTGGNDVDWHPSGSIFTGAGITEHGIYFSYASNWGAPGRWAIEIFTNASRYYLKPMERLAVQRKGSVVVEEIESNYQLDENYKPGIFKMVSSFLDGEVESSLCSIREHESNFKYYNIIGNY